MSRDHFPHVFAHKSTLGWRKHTHPVQSNETNTSLRNALQNASRKVNQHDGIDAPHLWNTLLRSNTISFSRGIVEYVKSEKNSASLESLIRTCPICACMEVLNISETFLVEGYNKHEADEVQQMNTRRHGRGSRGAYNIIEFPAVKDNSSDRLQLQRPSHRRSTRYAPSPTGYILSLM